LVVRYPDRARDSLAVLTPALRPPDVEDRDWLVTAKLLGEHGGVQNIGAVRLRNCHPLDLFRAYAVLIRNGSRAAKPLPESQRSPPNDRDNPRQRSNAKPPSGSSRC
jgi:hypothetical protein